MTDTLPVHDVAAEQALLGATLTKPDLGGPALLTVPADAWWTDRHKVLAAELADRIRRELPIDPTLVLAAVRNRPGAGADMGPYIKTLIDRAWMPQNAMYFAARVRACAGVRDLASACKQTLFNLECLMERGDEFDLAPLVADLTTRATEAAIAAGSTARPTPRTVLDLLAEREVYDWLVPGLMERGERLMLTGAEGAGKALALDTPVPTPKGWTTMGSLSVGDEVFAPDGMPTRIVAATNAMHGRPCYRIAFSDGSQIVADEQHLWLTETLRARECAAAAARRGPLKPRGTDQRHKRNHFPVVVTTRDMAETLWARNGHAINHSIQTSDPLQYPAQELPVDPYVLGAWLGDGHSFSAAITCADPEILQNIGSAGYSLHRIEGKYHWRITKREAIRGARSRAADLVRSGMNGREARRRVGLGESAPLGVETPRRGYHFSRSETVDVVPRIQSLQEQLRRLDVLNNKHIPPTYQCGSVEQRLALLQGLMDTDGTVSDRSGCGRGTGAPVCEFSICNERLARDVHELLLCLGVKVTWREAPAVLDGRVVGTRYRLGFQTDLPVFRLTRKAERLQPLRTRRAKLRYVTAVEPVESVPVRCIQVDRTDGMFVAGRECIPTHNSILVCQTVTSLAGGVHPFTAKRLDAPLRIAVVDCENPSRLARRRYSRMVPMVSQLATGLWDAAPKWGEHLFVEFRGDGLNLLSGRDVAWLENFVGDTSPDLLAIGPIYKLHQTNINDEQAARELTAVLDGIRTRHGCALLMEAHAGNGEDGRGRRLMRPIGSSLFRRWPEFGFGLVRSEDCPPHEEHPSMVDAVAWRGSREERSWPRKLRHGGPDELPWTLSAEEHVKVLMAEKRAMDPARQAGAA